MKLKNCPECGKLFVDNPSQICPECYAREQEDEQKVVDYLREVGRANVQQILEATGVKERVVYRMLRAGRLYNSVVEYPCQKCGRLISDGLLCPDCRRDIAVQQKSAPSPELTQRQLSNWETERNKKMFTKDMFGNK